MGGMEALLETLKISTTIKTFNSMSINNLKNCAQSPQVSYSYSLGKDLNDIEVCILAHFIKDSTSLTTLDVRHSSIGLVGGKALFTALKKSKSIKKMNGILLSKLRESSTITTIVLPQNIIGNT